MSSLEASQACAAILALHTHHAERQELLDAGVSSKTVEALYPLDQLSVTPTLVESLRKRPIIFNHIQIGLRRCNVTLTNVMKSNGLWDAYRIDLALPKAQATRDEVKKVQELNSLLREQAQRAGERDFLGMEALNSLGRVMWLMQQKSRLSAETLDQFDAAAIWVARTLLRLPD